VAMQRTSLVMPFVPFRHSRSRMLMSMRTMITALAGCERVASSDSPALSFFSELQHSASDGPRRALFAVGSSSYPCSADVLGGRAGRHCKRTLSTSRHPLPGTGLAVAGTWLVIGAWRALRTPDKSGFRRAFAAINYYAVMVMGAVILDSVLGR
jgi:hypothetical protein